MKNVLLSLLLILLAGCDYDIPISQTASAPANIQLAGIWIGTKDEGENIPLEIGITGNQYTVVYGNPGDSLSFSGFEVRPSRLSLIQLAIQESGKTRYLFVKYELTAEGLNVYRVNPDVVSGKCQTTEELTADLEIHKNNPFLFTEPLKFTRSAAQ